MNSQEIMRLQDSWNDERIVTSFLALMLSKGRLMPVLGPGFGTSIGLPSWPQLVGDLYKIAGVIPPPLVGSWTEQAEYFKHKHCKGDSDCFLGAVKQALYFGIDAAPQALGKIDILRAVGALMLSSKQHGGNLAVTFGLDDLLEIYLESHGVSVRSDLEGWHWHNNNDIVVCHPYGLLPLREKASRSPNIMLDGCSYARYIASDTSEWTSRIASHMRTHFCIFLGVSFQDAHIAGLLEEVRRSHVGRSEHLPFWGLTFVTPDHINSIPVATHRGIFAQVVADYVTLPQFLFKIISHSHISPKSGQIPNMISPSDISPHNEQITNMYSVFISYGGPDQDFASRLNETLTYHGVRTFLFSQHARPGEKLHRLMREGVNRHDRVVLVCSKNSLDRLGVLAEIEETLQREAREGGEAILIPIALDDYVFTDWAPKRRDIAQAIRDRVVADFRGTERDEQRYDLAIRRLLAELSRRAV